MNQYLHSHGARIPRSLLLSVSLLLVGLPLHAANNAFTNILGGSWEVSGNWSLGTAPSPTDTDLITNNGTYTVNINNTTADTDPGAGGWMTNANLYVGNTSGQPTLLVDFTNATKTLVVAGSGLTSLGGFANQQATMTMNNGQFSSYDFHVGDAAGSAATLNMNGGTLIVRDSAALVNTFGVGAVANSTGTVNLAGGIIDHSLGYSAIGTLSGSLGTMNISNGLFKSLYELVAYNTGSRGQLNLYGGTNLVNGGYLSIGNTVSATGAVLVAGGTLIQTNGVVYLGYGSGALGTITQSNGTVSFDTLYLADNGSSGRWNIYGGTASVSFITHIGGTTGNGGDGRFQVDNGLVNLHEVRLGSTPNSQGTWTINGGSNELLGTSHLYLGYAANSTGTLLQSGGFLDVSGNTYIGYSGAGTFTVTNATYQGRAEIVGVNAGRLGTLNILSGATNTIVSGTIDIGSNVGATGIVNVAGGVFSVNPAISTTYIGDWGRGILNQSNGLVNLGHTLMGVLANGGSYGEWNVIGGTGRVSGATIGNFLDVGYGAGSTGVVNVTGGSLELMTKIMIGYNNGAYGQMNVSGGTVVGTNDPANAYVYLGYSGGATGVLNVSGGQIMITNNNLYVGGAGVGYLNLSNGLVRVRHEVVGSSGGSGGAGFVNLYGGSNIIETGGFDIGSNPGATGRVLVASGYASANNGNISYIGDWGQGFLTVSNGLIELSDVHMGDLAAARGQWDILGGMGSVFGALKVANVNGATGLVTVANAGILDIHSTTALGTGATGAGSITNRDGGTVRFTGLNNPSITKTANGTFISTNAIVEFKDANAANLSGGITNITLLGNNTLSLNNATNANVGAYTFQTNASQTFASLRLINGGTRWQSTGTTIGNGGSLLASNTGASVQGAVTDQGTIQVVNSMMTFEDVVTISGRYISDPSTNTFLSNVVVTASGTMLGTAGDLFNFKKSLYISNTVNNTAAFNLASSTVSFSGGGLHTNAVTGHDFGNNGTNGYPDGFTAVNYSYGRLTLGTTNDLLFVTSGDSAASSNALYVTWLDLAGLTNSFSSVSNMIASLLFAPTNINIYYGASGLQANDSWLMDETYRLGDGNGGLGGFLMPAIPETSTWALFATACAVLLRRRRG